jgi:hypothetical protein
MWIMVFYLILNTEIPTYWVSCKSLEIQMTMFYFWTCTGRDVSPYTTGGDVVTISTGTYIDLICANGLTGAGKAT